MRQIGDLEKQLLLPRFETGSLRGVLRDLVTNFPDSRFRGCRRLPASTLRADFFAQAFTIRIQVLQRRFDFAAFRINLQQIIYAVGVVSATRCQSLFDKIRLFPNEPDIEHGAV
jgi:hypothetical protein